MRSFENRVAVITGAGSGIGQCLARQLAERGCLLAIADINATGLAETAGFIDETDSEFSTHQFDVAERDAVYRFADAVIERHGGADLLINNAGVTTIDTVGEQSDADFEWLMNVNFWGVVHGTRAFLPHLRKSQDAHIVNVSSLFGLMAMPLQASYNASKFAVRGFTEALKMELAGSNVNVSCVHPGGIKTAIARNSRIGAATLDVSRDEISAEFDKAARTTPEQAAAQIINGIGKNRRRILIGWDAKICDRIVRWFPGSYEKILGLERNVRRKAKERKLAEDQA